MTLTYQQLRDWLDTLTPAQMSCNVSVYAGDIDEAMPAFAVGFNTDEEMGGALDTLDPNHPIILI